MPDCANLLNNHTGRDILIVNIIIR